MMDGWSKGMRNDKTKREIQRPLIECPTGQLDTRFVHPSFYVMLGLILGQAEVLRDGR